MGCEDAGMLPGAAAADSWAGMARGESGATQKKAAAMGARAARTSAVSRGATAPKTMAAGSVPKRSCHVSVVAAAPWGL